jgi:hypothetical protein
MPGGLVRRRPAGRLFGLRLRDLVSRLSARLPQPSVRVPRLSIAGPRLIGLVSQPRVRLRCG